MNEDPVLLDRKDTALLVLLFFVAFAIRLYFLRFYEVISADGISYIAIAKDFITGKGLAGATHYPPFYPILVGLASIFTRDFEAAGLGVSIIMGSLVMVPVYLLGAEFFNRRTGFMAAVLTMTWPAIRFWSTNVMSQATYITLLLFGIYFLWRACGKGGAIPAVLAGASFGCAHLTRSEGILVYLAVTSVLILFTFVNRLPGRKLWYVLISWCVFFVVFSPYLYMLHELTGKWQLTGKSRITIADALSQYLGKPDLKLDPSFKEVGYLDLFRLYPDYIRTNYLKNLKECWEGMLPLYGWALAGVGCLAGGWSREKLFERMYLLATFAPLAVIIVFFFIGPEYTQPYLPVLFLWTGNGLFQIEAWADNVIRTGEGGFAGRYGWCIPVVLVMFYGTWNVVRDVPADRDKPYDFTMDGGRLDDKRIGLRLREMLPPDAVVMTRSGRIGFYSQRPYFLPPQAPYAEIIAFARKNSIGYLIASPQLYFARPQLRFIFTPLLEPGKRYTPPPELELVYIGQEPGGLPYLVYHVR